MLDTKHCLLKQLIYWYKNASSTIAFLNEDKFLYDEKFTLWGIPNFLVFTWVKLNVEVNYLLTYLNKIIRNQGTYFVVIMNNRLKIISVIGAPL